MLDPRIYRAALLPVLVALIVVAFSLENRPAPLRTTFAPDAFDGARAARLMDRLSSDFPSRRPGSAGDDGLARRVALELRRALPRVTVRVRGFRARTIDGRRELVTVSAEQPGSASRAQIVVVAERDATGRRAAAQLSGTAALLELARALADARPARTITFASVSGGSGGQAGIRELVGRLRRPVDAVLELGDLAGPVGEDPIVVAWSNDLGAAPVRLQRTVALAAREETGLERGAPFARRQLARFAIPMSVSGQGIADADGLPAVRLSASGELPPPADAPASADRLESFGRAALRALTALDAGTRIETAPQRDLLIARKVLPGWAMRVLVIALLLPALLTAGDAAARLRRRREPLWPWVGWVLALAAPLLLAALFARGLGLTDAIPATGPPAPPGTIPIDRSAWAALACTVVVVLLAGLLVRPLLSRWAGAGGPPDGPGAALAPVFVVCLVGVAAWVVNPYAALLLVLPANLWLLVAAREMRMRRAPAVAVVLVSLVPVVLAVLSVGLQLGASAGEMPWFWLLTVAGGQLGPLALLGWSIACGAAAGALLVALAPRGASLDDRAITVRGPTSYAGPGSLGGTDSAMRR